MDSHETSSIIIGSEFPNRVIPLISNARHSIDIIVFDWRIYPSDPNSAVQGFTNAIFSAAKRGVAVRAMVNNEGLMYTLRQSGVDAKRLYHAGLVHAKFILIDRTVAIVGSHNFTQGGFTTNLEISCILNMDSEQNKLANYFNQVWPL